MECGLLFSGGKDSSLTSLLLEPFFDVTLVTVTFGVTDDWRYAEETADQLGFDFDRLELDRSFAETAIGRIRDDGSPRNAIQSIHVRALESVAAMDYDAIADGTRRDDRVPSISRAQAQRMEETFDVDYLAPLSGFGRRAVDRLVDANLTVTVGQSDEINRADYETELRALLAADGGPALVEEVFPDHEQTHVRGFR